MNNSGKKSPYAVIVEADTKYGWCQCGLSQKLPFCDGAHKGSGMKSVKFTPETTRTVYLCGCLQTKNPPYCDGSHENL